MSDSWATKTRLLGSFCGGQDDVTVEAYSGVMSVFYSDDDGPGMFKYILTTIICRIQCFYGPHEIKK